MNDASLMSNFVSALVLLLTWHWYCTIIGLKSADSYIACLDKIKMILKVHTRCRWSKKQLLYLARRSVKRVLRHQPLLKFALLRKNFLLSVFPSPLNGRKKAE